MAGFNVSKDATGDAWFRLGRFEITSTLLVALLGAVGIVTCAFVPALFTVGFLDPGRVLSGEVWRLVTWPFVDRVSLWSVLTLVLLWYFGTDLERQVGRRNMMWLLVGIWSVQTVLALVVGTFLGGAALASLGTIQFVVLLLWIAENPRRPFFFGIPAWVIGAVLVAVQVLGFIAARDIVGLFAMLASVLVAGMIARSMGLLSDLTWLPGRRTAPRPSAPRAPAASRSQQRQAQRMTSDAERIDTLLEKISEHGIHSLTPAERKELEKLRQRRQSR